MPHLFRVTNPHGEVWYMDADGREITRGEAIVEARKRRYADPEDEKNYLVEILSTDDEFEQRYYLKVIARGEDTLIKMDAAANAFLTPAVRGAAMDLARRLSPEAPDAEGRR